MKYCQDSSYNCKKKLEGKYWYYDINTATENMGIKVDTLPYSIRVLLENLLRFEDGKFVKKEDIKCFSDWPGITQAKRDISFMPARVLMQDFTGVPAIVDLAAMRDVATNMKIDPKMIDPKIPVDLIIDHSVQVDHYATKDALDYNVMMEIKRNKERYQLLQWGQGAFDNFKVVPPGTGICHQVNLEYIAKVIFEAEQNGERYLYPDTLIGTDSHTTMINALAVLGWGVGGIEAEAAMLGQPVSMLIPEVVCVSITGRLKEGVTATDLVLYITSLLRKEKVVGKFVECIGPGLKNLTLADRATISNMSPEYGATCCFFPIDSETIRYLKLTGREQHHLNMVESYAKAQSMWHDTTKDDQILYSKRLEVDLSTIEPSIAGPTRPQDMVYLRAAAQNFAENFPKLNKGHSRLSDNIPINNKDYSLANGSVVIAAITSCTNTSNPFVMLGAGILAKKAYQLGLKVKPWVKTSLAPGSKVVSKYLEDAGLQEYLDLLGFNLVGYGCTTCIGNSGPLDVDIATAIAEYDLVVAAVLSGNRNFEARIHPDVRANYLASPPLCVAYAIAGNIMLDLFNEPLGQGKDGKDVYLSDIWPTSEEIKQYDDYITPSIFKDKYKDVFEGDKHWKDMGTKKGIHYSWDNDSTYVKNPPFFSNRTGIKSIDDARVLLMLGDSVTTDHISPAGRINPQSAAGQYLLSLGVEERDFNSYGARRGNYEVMVRGTFANNRIKNLLLKDGTEGSFTLSKDGKVKSVYDVAMEYKDLGRDLVVIAGKEYGTGSSRDWAAKGTKLLGIKCIIAESFERIHRSNLIGMGVIPMVFKDITIADLALDGSEDIYIDVNDLALRSSHKLSIKHPKKEIVQIDLQSAIETEFELEYLHSHGILNYTMMQIAKSVQ